MRTASRSSLKTAGCCARKSLAITANQPFSEWGHVFAEPAMTLATVDRLVHHATLFEMNAPPTPQSRKADPLMPRFHTTGQGN